MIADLVNVWLVRTDLPSIKLAELESLLDSDERQRAEALLADEDRRRFTAAHGAARLIIGHHCGVAPELLGWTHGPHGKPELTEPLAGVCVSLSHSGDLTALAVIRHRRVGVDVQRCLTGLDVIRMSARYYPAAEAAFVAAAHDPDRQADRFLRLWTRKEAYVKVGGGRLLQGMPLATRGTGPIVVSAPEDPSGSRCLIRDFPVPPGFHGAVAVEGTRPFRVMRHWWPGTETGDPAL